MGDEESIDDVKQAYALLFKAHGKLRAERDALLDKVRDYGGRMTDEQSSTLAELDEAIERRAALAAQPGSVGEPARMQDRLLSALERAARAETALRALVDECGNDAAPGWEERMTQCINSANELLAAAPTEAKPAPAPGYCKHCKQYTIEEPLPAQQDAVDAERYRLLRRGQHWSVIDGIGNVLRGDDLDAAINAARASKGTP